MGCGNSDEAKQLFFPLQAGCHNFDIGLRVPNTEVARVDKFFADHEAFMRSTHNATADGSKEPHTLGYFVTKVAERKNPLDAQEGLTENTLYGLTETYRSSGGCDAHLAAGRANEALFKEFSELVGLFGVGEGLGQMW